VRPEITERDEHPLSGVRWVKRHAERLDWWARGHEHAGEGRKYLYIHHLFSLLSRWGLPAVLLLSIGSGHPSRSRSIRKTEGLSYVATRGTYFFFFFFNGDINQWSLIKYPEALIFL
jgi:hypothetical protein